MNSSQQHETVQDCELPQVGSGELENDSIYISVRVAAENSTT